MPLDLLGPYLKPQAQLSQLGNGIAAAPLPPMSPGMQANAWFFSHPRWGRKYFEHENHRHLIGERWQAATGSWDGKVVVDMGCGPGNLYRSVNGRPAALIGVDVSEAALEHARTLGYTPLLADVHDTPLRSECADLVTANAVLHHVDDMAAVLAEAARLVKPGGMLVTDEDPLQCKHRLTRAGRWMYRFRSLVPVSRVRHHPRYKLRYTSYAEQRERSKTEIHLKFPGDGVLKQMFFDVLEPMGFTVRLYPHGHVAGRDIFEGGRGKNTAYLQMSQRASGIDPDQADLLLSVMCVATRDRV
jgi:ubiquinone/menaquinone biosynthesis C-methylase UbiE